MSTFYYYYYLTLAASEAASGEVRWRPRRYVKVVLLQYLALAEDDKLSSVRCRQTCSLQ